MRHLIWRDRKLLVACIYVFTTVPLFAQDKPTDLGRYAGRSSGKCRRAQESGAKPGGQLDQRSSPGELEFQHRTERPDTECLERSAGGSG